LLKALWAFFSGKFVKKWGHWGQWDNPFELKPKDKIETSPTVCVKTNLKILVIYYITTNGDPFY
jgi:hypothetical protein